MYIVNESLIIQTGRKVVIFGYFLKNTQVIPIVENCAREVYTIQVLCCLGPGEAHL